MAVNRIAGELGLFLVLVIVSEIARQVAKHRCPDGPLVHAFLVCNLVLGWYSTSVTLVLFNKWVLSSWMSHDMQSPILYSCTHMFLKGVFALSFLTGWLRQPLVVKDMRTLRIAIMVGVAVGLDVAASNLSFQYISVTFYVMVKASALLWILTFSVASRLEPCSWQIVSTILVISLGIFFSMYGEAHFNLTGFLLVFASEIFAAARWVGTQALVQDGEVDSVTAVLYMSPGSFLSLLPLVVARERSQVAAVFSDGKSVGEYFLLCLVPSFLAFLLLLIEVRLVKETSSLTLCVFGNLKSIVTILFAIVVFHDHARPIQWFGLLIGMAGMVGYSHFKNSQPSVGSHKYESLELVSPSTPTDSI